jgi:hypothetical protein
VSWTKQRLVIPAPPPLAWASSHAALPVVQALDGDGLKLYFSSRDAYGRSHIAAAEVVSGAALDELRYEREPVLAPGPLGTFDDAGVTSACIVDCDGRLYQYYSGWSLGVSVPFYFYVGCAISEDGGETFRKASQAPVLERDEVDPFLTASPWVLIENGVWRMWYVSGTGWELDEGSPKHRYHIKYAESSDGLRWRRTGHVCIDYRDPAEFAIARPCVLHEDGRYRMWFCARGESYRLGYAESADGLAWERHDERAGLEPSGEAWDSEMIAYPCVFDRLGERYLLYNGNGYGETGIGCAVSEPGA